MRGSRDASGYASAKISGGADMRRLEDECERIGAIPELRRCESQICWDVRIQTFRGCGHADMCIRALMIRQVKARALVIPTVWNLWKRPYG